MERMYMPVLQLCLAAAYHSLRDSAQSADYVGDPDRAANIRYLQNTALSILNDINGQLPDHQKVCVPHRLRA